MERLTDDQLMELLRQGRTDSLDELYRRYARRLFAFCRNATRSKNPQDPQDLVQDVFVRVIKGAHTFNPRKASFHTWLFRIARNHCIDTRRRRGKVKTVPIVGSGARNDLAEQSVFEDSIADPTENVEDSVIRDSVIEAVRECIDALEDEDERQAIVLYYLGGKAYREIGGILGTSTSTARNRIESAQERIKRCLERRGVNSAS